MKQKKSKFSLRALLFTAVLLIISSRLFAASLQLGADYLLRGVQTTERENTISGNSYYDQRIQAYLSTSLSKEVEATVRVQSITPWGLEGSTSPLTTIYPNANGNLWVQNAFIRLPNIWQKRIVLTVGRQPIQWGDGQILSDDERGFNAIRAQIKSPVKWLNFDLDAFTAKIKETLREKKDSDLNGALLGFDHDYVRWEIMGLWDNDKAPQNYELGAETIPVVVSQLNRVIYGVRAKANLKDAYLVGAYYMQSGKIKRGGGQPDITLDGSAYQIGLGGRQENKVIGRVGAFAEVTEGSGDQASTPNTDEAFRPTFSSRWSGLERMGQGRYFAATFSDATSPSDPFAPASSTNDGLPPGTSGIQSWRFGLEFNPWAPWVFTFDYYQYKALKNQSGPKDLGTEFDYGIAYQYSGLVTVKATSNDFIPGKAFDEATSQKANLSSIEIQVKF